MEFDDVRVVEFLEEFDFAEGVVGYAEFFGFGADFDLFDCDEFGGVVAFVGGEDVGVLT